MYPLPRGEGYEFFVQLWNGDVCHFTLLSSYQVCHVPVDFCPKSIAIGHLIELNYHDVRAFMNILLNIASLGLFVFLLTISEMQFQKLVVEQKRLLVEFSTVNIFENFPFHR